MTCGVAFFGKEGGNTMLVKGKTASGFKYEVESETLKSWKFITSLQKCQNKKTPDGEKLTALIEIFSNTVGDELIDSLIDHLEQTLSPEEKVGGVPARAMFKELNEIIAKVGESAKN